MKFATTLALTAYVANGLWNSCTPGDYDTFMQGAMLGFHSDPSSTAAIDGDCMLKTRVFGNKVTQLFNSFSNYQFSDWAAPLYLLSEASVANTDLFAACQTTNFAKQTSVRFATIPGAVDFGMTFVAAIIKNYTTGESDLFNAMTSIFTTDAGCAQMAQDFGRTLHFAFNYTAPDVAYTESLSLDLVSEVF